MCALNWQLLSCSVSHPRNYPLALLPCCLPPFAHTGLPNSPPPASCSSLGGLSWSETIKLQWEAAWRKHGCALALLSVNCTIPVPDSEAPISFSDSTGDLWPHVGHSQTHKLTSYIHTIYLWHMGEMCTDTHTHKGHTRANPYITQTDIITHTHMLWGHWTY